MCFICFICLRLCLSIWTAPQQFLLGNPHQKLIHHDTQYQTGPLYQTLLKALPCYHHENLWGHLMFSQAHHYISNHPLWAKRVIIAMPSSQIALPPLPHLLLRHLLLMAPEGICRHRHWHKKWTFIPLLGHLFLHDKALLSISLNSLPKLTKGSTHTHPCTEMDHHCWRMPILPESSVAGCVFSCPQIHCWQWMHWMCQHWGGKMRTPNTNDSTSRCSKDNEF